VSSEKKSQPTEAKERQVVVSVRFPAQLLQRIHAVAAVEDTTANAVIREGMDHYIRERVRTDTFQEASRAYVERAQAHVATALMDPPEQE
jgi:predicted DNA-binding protein